MVNPTAKPVEMLQEDGVRPPATFRMTFSEKYDIFRLSAATSLLKSL